MSLAPFQSRQDRIAVIERANAAVRRKVHSIPSREEAGDMGIRAAENRVKAELEREFGAKFSFSAGAYQLRMAGIGASCTAGFSGLLSGWQRCAATRIAKIKVGGA